MLKGLCEIVQFLLNAVIIVTSFVPVQHCVFVISIFMCECAVLIIQKLLFGVCHCCYCLLIYDYSIIVLCFIISSHRMFLFFQILNLFICDIFEPNCFASDNAIHKLQLLIINTKYSNQVLVIKHSNHWRLGLYQG